MTARACKHMCCESPPNQLAQVALLILPFNSKESQAPQLLHITLGRAVRTERHSFKHTPCILPAPDFAIELRGVLLNDVPEVIVGVTHFTAQCFVFAKV
jgi:hypothetical protein